MQDLRTITFLRHAQADKSLPNHRLPPLSEEGIRQAQKRRVQLGNPTFDLVFYSPLIRTQMTARIVAGMPSPRTLVETSSLFFEENDLRGHVIDKSFEKLGHASLRAYYEDDARDALTSLSFAAYGVIALIFDHKKAQNALVVGHGVMLPSLCSQFCAGASHFDELILGECEGIRLRFGENARVNAWERIP